MEPEKPSRAQRLADRKLNRERALVSLGLDLKPYEYEKLLVETADSALIDKDFELLNEIQAFLQDEPEKSELLAAQKTLVENLRLWESIRLEKNRPPKFRDELVARSQQARAALDSIRALGVSQDNIQ